VNVKAGPSKDIHDIENVEIVFKPALATTRKS
jgi:hypothetical protein